jgi:cation transport regulator ChaB
MLYPSIASLPAAVRADLSIEAQQLYRTAYNSAWTQYGDFVDRAPFCHRLARSEVRQINSRQPDRALKTRAAAGRTKQET